MSYNKKNLLKRIIEIQDITLEHTNRGVTQEWVFRNIIAPRFYISKSTYYNYLGFPAKRELKMLEDLEWRHLNLFD
jgi:hypothetical protein